MRNFFKGIIVGIGGVAPGLSGSVLLIIFGLYQKVLEALSTIMISPKKKIQFLFPIVSGMFCGVLLFSKAIDYCLIHFEMITRFCFLGLILGTIPLFYKELKKEGYDDKYYVLVGCAILLGYCLFTLNPNSFKQLTNLSIIQSIVLGIAVVATAIIPGLDPAVVLSTLGLYEAYVKALANFDLTILLPMLIGLVVGGIVISFVMSQLFKKHYTVTFSIIFGLFLSMIPNMLNESCMVGLNMDTFISFVLMIFGFGVSFYLGDINENNRRLKTLLKKKGISSCD